MTSWYRRGWQRGGAMQSAWLNSRAALGRTVPVRGSHTKVRRQRTFVVNLVVDVSSERPQCTMQLRLHERADIPNE
jgi:hypothetical protein